MHINYKDIPLEYIDKETVNKTLEFIKLKKLERANFNLTRSIMYFHKKYQVKKTNDSVEIIWCIGGTFKRLKWSQNKAYPEAANNEGWTGQTAYEYINEEYIATKKNKKSLFSDISGKKYKKEYNDIKKCVPAAINYIRHETVGKVIDKVYKADVSSAYPAAACGSIPTLHNFKRVTGRIEPTEEYPFAFYIKSHHLAIYNELDTRKFKKSIYYPQYKHPAEVSSWAPLDNIKAEDDETILCKDSGISLKAIFEKLYNNRKEHSEFKFIMNAFIGRCQYNGDPFMSHLSAVVLARTVNNMIERCNILVKEKSSPIFISTDSIAWRGSESECAVEEKYLGSFTYEAKNTKWFSRGLKAYQYIDMKGEISCVCGHISKTDERRKTFGAIPEVAAGDYYVIEEDGHITEIM